MARSVNRAWVSTALLVGGFLLATSIDARADLQLSITEGVAASTGTAATPGVVSGSGVIGDYSINFIASASNSPGTTLSTLSITTLEVTRLTALFGDPLFISASGTGYTVPPGAGDFSASYTANFTKSLKGDKVVFDTSSDPGNNNMAQVPPIVFGALMGIGDQANIGTAPGATNLPTRTFIYRDRPIPSQPALNRACRSMFCDELQHPAHRRDSGVGLGFCILGRRAGSQFLDC
jgi:hypothetical protein